MTTDRHLERDLPTILGEISMGRYPDYIDDVLATTAQRRQRPAWTFPERWFPVDLATKALPGAPRFPWRAMAALALLALLLGAVLTLYVGSPKRLLPAPFGRADNGSIVFVDGGDIYTADPTTGATTAIVVGPERDLRPIFSLDGTHIAFERRSEDASKGRLFVARADGRAVVPVMPEPIAGLSEWSFSPDGRSIVALTPGDGEPAILVVPSDGSTAPAFFEVGATLGDGAPRYSPDGSEIIFVGRQPGEPNRGVYALNPATSNVRPVVAASTTIDIHSAALSPDGTRIAYGTYDPSVGEATARTHVVSADGTGDIVVNTDPERYADTGGDWSNDGTRLVITGFYLGDAGETVRSAVVPVDRSSAGVTIDCPPGAAPEDCTADWIWSPDDSVLLAVPSDAGGRPVPLLLADPLTGKIRNAPWAAAGDLAWQRVAK